MKYFRKEIYGDPTIKFIYGKSSYGVNYIDLGKISAKTAINIINEYDSYFQVSKIVIDSNNYGTGLDFYPENIGGKVSVVGINENFIKLLAEKSLVKRQFLKLIEDNTDNSALIKKIKDFLYFNDRKNSKLSDELKLSLELSENDD